MGAVVSRVPKASAQGSALAFGSRLTRTFVIIRPVQGGTT